MFKKEKRKERTKKEEKITQKILTGEPTIPGGPRKPIGPGEPGRPIVPWGPVLPAGPGRPGGPGNPGGPWKMNKNLNKTINFKVISKIIIINLNKNKLFTLAPCLVLAFGPVKTVGNEGGALKYYLNIF